MSFMLLPAKADELSIVGTGDGVDMLQALATKFHQMEPSVDVKVPPSIGSGGGITAVGAGTAKLARVARTLTDAEKARGLVYVPLAKLPSAIFVHPGVGVKNLTYGQLADIYAGKLANWKDLGGADLRIRVVRREEADSTLVILRGSMPGWRDLEITDRSKTAVSTQEAVETVKTTPGAVGFGPYSKALEAETRVLAVDGKHPSDPSYPSSGLLAFVHRSDMAAGDASRFIAFAKSREAAEIIRGFGAIPVAD